MKNVKLSQIYSEHRAAMTAIVQIAFTCFAVGLVGCRSKPEQPAVLSLIEFLASDSAGVISGHSLDVRCDSLVLDGIGYSDKGEGCSRRVADSLFYLYRGSKNQVLVRGKRVLVKGRPLQPLIDSLIAAMGGRFGHGASCASYDRADPYFARLHIWHEKGNTLYLHASVLNDSSALRPGITVEFTTGSRTCSMEVSGPPTRM